MAKKKSKYRTRKGIMGGAKQILELATVGGGSYLIGEKVSQHVGVSPIIPSAVIGYVAKGWKGLLASIAFPMVLGATGSLRPFTFGQRETVTGVVWT